MRPRRGRWAPAPSSARARFPIENRAFGSSCIAERRALETIEHGAPKTPFLKFGDRVRIEMLDAAGHSIFGAIDQILTRYATP